MIRRPPRSTRTYTLFPYTTRFRSVCGLHRALDAQLALAVPVDANAHAVDGQRVAERDQFMGALDGHGAGDDRGLDDAALGALQPAGAQLRRDGRRELHPAFGDGFARGDGLGGHVNHGGAALGVEVVEFADGFRSHYSRSEEAVMAIVRSVAGRVGKRGVSTGRI